MIIFNFISGFVIGIEYMFEQEILVFHLGIIRVIFTKPFPLKPS